MRTFKLAACLAGLLAVVGCATPTPYVPAASSADHGYRETKVATDTWRVRFSANSVTERETVENYLLFRAAELTLAEGRRWFVVTDRDVEPRTTYYRDDPYVSPSIHYGHGRHGGGVGFGVGISTVSPSTEYLAVIGIRLLASEPPKSQHDAFEASDVIEHLRPELRRKNNT